MQKFFRYAVTRHWHCLGIALVALSVIAVAPASAVEVKDLYSAEVPIDPADPKSRDLAYQRALQQVLVRVTGSEAAAVSPELTALFPNPARFVLQYRPLPENRLWVALDGAAIENVLRDRGLPVWSNERPLTMVWLVVDNGRGQRDLVIAAEDDAASRFDPGARVRDAMRERVTRVAASRGLPVVFPRQGDVERADIKLSDVWGGFHDPLQAVARSQDIAAVLVGRARPGDAERSRWSFYSGSQRQQWNGDIEDALHQLADTLAGEFVVAGNAQLELVELAISNVNSAAAFAKVQGMIGELQVIDDYRIRAVNGSEIRYAVRINGGVRRLATALNFKNDLAQLATDPATGMPLATTSLHYAYRP